MAFTKEIPQWENAGQKPPQSKITEGFKPLDHPPADWFNWFFNGAYEALKELQDGAASSEEVKAALKVLSDALLTHSNAKNNPHAVTKSQIGLGNVDNIKQASKVDFDSHVNNSQNYKLTADDGKHLIAVSSGGSIFDAIKDKGTCTFYAPSGVSDSPAPNNAALRGIQTVGQNNIGTGFAVDTSGNAYYFYYNSTHISITWTQLPTAADKDKWNNGQLYKMTQDSGTRKLIPDGSDLLTLPTGFYFGINNRLLNNPDPSDTGWFNYDVSESGSGRKMIIAVASFNNKMWFGTVHTNGDFKGWKRALTDDELSSTWNQVTLVAGTATKQFAGNPLKFSIRQNELLLRGSFEGVPANETVIARFAQKPSAKTVFVGATVGSYGSARFTLDTDGSLRFDGMSANDNSYVSRFEMNESIPLW